MCIHRTRGNVHVLVYKWYRRTGNVLEGVVADHVDDGADDRLAVASDLVEQRLQPALRRLAVRVEERAHAPARRLRALEPRADQTRALLQADHLHRRRQTGHVLVQRRAQVPCTPSEKARASIEVLLTSIVLRCFMFVTSD